MVASLISNISSSDDLLRAAVKGYEALGPHADAIDALFRAARASKPEILTDLMNGNVSTFLSEARKIDNLDPAARAVTGNADFSRLLTRAASNHNLAFFNDLNRRLSNGQ